MTGLLLVRHDQASHSLDGRWEGWGATSLTEEGVAWSTGTPKRCRIGGRMLSTMLP